MDSQLLVTFNHKKQYFEPWGWGCTITPPLFYESKVTAGDKYIFKYSFKSDINFDWFLIQIADTAKEAGFFTLLCPPLKLVTYGKADTEYKGAVILYARKSATSEKPISNVFLMDLFANSEKQPTLTFTKFELDKITD